MAFEALLESAPETAKITLNGELDAQAAVEFKAVVEKAAQKSPKRLVLFMEKLTFLASAGLRVLIFAKQKMGMGVDLFIIGSQGPVRATLEMSGFHHSVYIQDAYTDIVP